MDGRTKKELMDVIYNLVIEVGLDNLDQVEKETLEGAVESLQDIVEEEV